MGLMDLTIRDWMVIVGVLLILAVLLDAWRRIRSDNYSRVKMDLVDPEEIPPEPENEYQFLRELPNGGARVVPREDVPSPESGQMAPSDGVGQGEEVVADNLDWLEGMNATGDMLENPGRGMLQPGEEPEVIMLNVVARNPAGFKGEDILHILLACDLRFGEMSFFHRHEQEKGRGAIQFSVANMMQPGVFDIDNMAKINTPGLVFFLTLPGPDDMMQAFEYMLETAQAVARNLGGDVLDESRSALTRQSLDHARGRITELERRLLAQAR